MNDFDGLLSSDFGLKPQGKSAPMSATKSSSRSSSSSLNFDLGSGTSKFDSDAVFGSMGAQKKPLGREDFGDLFGGPPKSKDNSFDFDSMFAQGSKSSSSLPVYDRPKYDDDIFEGLPGVKSFGSSMSGKKYGDEFESVPVSASSPPRRNAGGSSAFDDLLGGFGKTESQSKNRSSVKEDRAVPDFDDLIPGFGGSNPPSERSTHKPTWSSEPASTTRKASDDPFAGLGSLPSRAAPSSADSSDPLQEFGNLGKSGSRKADGPSVSSGVAYDDLDPFEGLAKSVPSSSSETNGHWKDNSPLRSDRESDKSPLRSDRESSGSPTYNSEEHVDKTSPRVGARSHKPVSTNNSDVEYRKTFFDMPSASNSFTERTEPVGTVPYENIYSSEASVPGEVYEEKADSSDDVWLTVSEIPLFTQPTTAPPPARPPPPRPTRASKVGNSSFGSKQAKKSEFYASSTFEIPKSAPETRSNTINEFEDYPPMGRNTRYNSDAQANGVSSEEMDFNSDAAASAAAMKEAMDRAEAKFRQAKGVRERESTRAARTRESVQLEKDDDLLDAEERALREKQEQLRREREDEEREHRRTEREREEKEREQRRVDRERERVREERERARQVVERANREARERAAADARAKAERDAVNKVNAEARGRAERTAVLRAQAEARERAAADAKERAARAAEARDREARMREKETAEAREKEAREKSVEARRRAERAAVERAAAEARQRAAAEAQERAAAAARANQRKNDNDLESFFSMGRASSAPRPRANSAEASFDAQFPTKKGPEVARTSDTTASNMRKASSSVNIVDDLSSIFGGGPTSGGFQDIEGETEERRRSRLERHQRTQERAAKALAEKNQRDLDVQREQAERNRFSESLDAEIKRWAAGKEGNLRALLSTLQYVLWPECGWQPVSLTDLITAAAVKKVYRKATLCIHPDKVQQKGANLQQKYIAEKVFDLLKEAWNKLNSEELF